MKEEQTPLPEVADESTVLVVDDTPENLRLLSKMLTESGYRALAVTSGERALESVAINPPDLVLLDVMMPGLSGFEVCRRLKEDPATSDIPVIFISALGGTGDKIAAFTAGGVDYVTKPFQVEEVLARVETHISLRRLQLDLHRTNDHLAQANAQLTGKNEELDAFAHTVAHDIKGPIGTILTLANLILDEGVPLSEDKRGECLHAIARLSQKMASIVDGLLLLASVKDPTQVGREELDMNRTVNEVLLRFQALIEKSGAEIIRSEELPPAVGYGPWIEEVWANYVSNAIKHGGQPPRVHIGASSLDDGGVRYWVRDNGQGITREDQTRLFRPFERLNQAGSQGYGLGLSIVRRIVECLGGRVGVESENGGGSEFFFELHSVQIQPPETSSIS